MKGMSEGSPLACSAVPSSPSREGQTPVSFVALWHWVSATQGHVDRWSPQKLFPTLAESEWRVEVPTALPPSAQMVLSHPLVTALLITKEAQRQPSGFTSGQQVTLVFCPFDRRIQSSQSQICPLRSLACCDRPSVCH